MTIKAVKWWLIILAILGFLSFLTQGLLSLAKQGERYETRIREQAKAECTAYWQAEIAKSNAAALRRQNELQEKALIAEHAFEGKRAELEAELEELEAKNATLSDNSCGLDAAHIGLLNTAAGTAGH